MRSFWENPAKAFTLEEKIDVKNKEQKIRIKKLEY